MRTSANYLRVSILLLFTVFMAACAPKIDTSRISGIWASNDGARLLMIRSDGKIVLLVPAGVSSAGTAYTADIKKFNAKSETVLEFASGENQSSAMLSADGTQLSVTIQGSAAGETISYRKAAASDLNNLGVVKTEGAGSISLNDQNEISFSYKQAAQGSVIGYKLTSKGLPDLHLYLFKLNAAGVSAIIFNEDEARAYRVNFTSTADGSITLEPQHLSAAEHNSQGTQFAISSTADGVTLRELP